MVNIIVFGRFVESFFGIPKHGLQVGHCQIRVSRVGLQFGQDASKNRADVGALVWTGGGFLLAVVVLGQAVAGLADLFAHLGLVHLLAQLGVHGGLLDGVSQAIDLGVGNVHADDLRQACGLFWGCATHSSVQAVGGRLDMLGLALDERAGPAAPGAHQPAVHGERTEVAVQVGEKAVADLGANDGRALDHGVGMLAAWLEVFADRADLAHSEVGLHELAQVLDAPGIDQFIEQGERVIDRALGLATFDVGGHDLVFFVVAVSLLGQFKVLVDLQAVGCDGQRPGECEACVFVGRDLWMHQGHDGQRLACFLVVPADGVGVLLESKQRVFDAHAHQVLSGLR